MITLLTWVSIFAGGLLILLFLMSLLGGFDLDIDVGSTEVDADGGGLGLIKGFLTFISVTSWVAKILIGSEQNPAIAGAVGIVAGFIAVVILSKLFKLLLKNEENVNWSMEDTLFSNGEVYLRIPPGGSGIVNIDIKGVNRELKAKSDDVTEIETGTAITVVGVDGEYVTVSRL